MADTEKKWYVLRAVSGKEAKVKEYIDAQLRLNEKLAERVFEVLLPMEKHATVRKDGKRVVKEKLSLPGYVLVQANMTPDVASTLRFMPNVLGFLGGMSEPSLYARQILIVCWVMWKILNSKKFRMYHIWLVKLFRLLMVLSVVSMVSSKR